MFFPEQHVRVYLCDQPTDMRKSYDGLHALVRYVLKKEPLSGHLFVFMNRKATQMKVLYWDRSGFCLWGKRLEQGVFLSDWNKIPRQELDWTALKLMLEGIEVKAMKKRYRLSEKHRIY